MAGDPGSEQTWRERLAELVSLLRVRDAEGVKEGSDMLTAGILTTSGKKKILDLLDLLGLRAFVSCENATKRTRAQHDRSMRRHTQEVNRSKK
eukprot:759356-Hanusia_phi.AAC.2